LVRGRLNETLNESKFSVLLEEEEPPLFAELSVTRETENSSRFSSLKILS
jgi:hypothetical protein